ncbi:hypothetical protein EVAR_22053_1 [Eumeta japonica]|uniref:Uncharacterized protein n=1 Tax=Eumeta variegata TaxID=151549 RepID=A0A4C1USJ9_EUMVA|nr:hypothetical protein EVAR_22053_1 [Eumeta japonica]
MASASLTGGVAPSQTMQVGALWWLVFQLKLFQLLLRYLNYYLVPAGARRKSIHESGSEALISGRGGRRPPRLKIKDNLRSLRVKDIKVMKEPRRPPRVRDPARTGPARAGAGPEKPSTATKRMTRFVVTGCFTVFYGPRSFEWC